MKREASLRGVKCKICEAIGEHFPTDCPKRNTVGTPGQLVGVGVGVGVPAPDEHPAAGLGAVHESVPFVKLESVMFNALYMDFPPDFLPSKELIELVRRRPDAPSWLRCYACMLLAQDAVWLPCCDVVACKGCVAPSSEISVWYCPKCDGPLHEDQWFGPTAIRKTIEAWTTTTMDRAPYGVPRPGVTYVAVTPMPTPSDLKVCPVPAGVTTLPGCQLQYRDDRHEDKALAARAALLARGYAVAVKSELA